MSFVDIGKIDLPDWQFDEEDWNNDLGNLRKDKLTIFRHIDSICLQWQYAKGKPYKVAQKTDFYDKYYDKKFFTELEQKLHDFYGHGYFVSLLFARLKPNGRIRPIACGTILRRVVATATAKHITPSVAASLKPHQYAVGRTSSQYQKEGL